MPSDGAFSKYVGAGKFPKKPKPVIHAGPGLALCGQAPCVGHIVLRDLANSDCEACKRAGRKAG